MCRRVVCETCGRPSWAGCGAHVSEVLSDVPVADRCQCPREPAAGRAPVRRSLLSRLRRR